MSSHHNHHHKQRRPRSRDRARPQPSPEYVKGLEVLAARMSSALEQAAAGGYHLGVITAQFFDGATGHGMPHAVAVDLATDMLAHLLHRGLPLDEPGDDTPLTCSP